MDESQPNLANFKEERAHNIHVSVTRISEMVDGSRVDANQFLVDARFLISTETIFSKEGRNFFKSLRDYDPLKDSNLANNQKRAIFEQRARLKSELRKELSKELREHLGDLEGDLKKSSDAPEHRKALEDDIRLIFLLGRFISKGKLSFTETAPLPRFVSTFASPKFISNKKFLKLFRHVERL